MNLVRVWLDALIKIRYFLKFTIAFQRSGMYNQALSTIIAPINALICKKSPKLQN